MSDVRWIYIEQFEGWWRYTPEAWCQLVQRVMATGVYDLDNPGPGRRRLSQRPRAIHRDRQGGLWQMSNEVRFVQPLDWTDDEWRAEAEMVGIK